MSTITRETAKSYGITARRGLGAMVLGLGALTACTSSGGPQQAEKPPVCSSLRVRVLDAAKHIVSVSADYADTTPSTRVVDIAYIFDRSEGATPFAPDVTVTHVYPALPEKQAHEITAIIDYEHDGGMFGSPATCTTEVAFAPEHVMPSSTPTK